MKVLITGAAGFIGSNLARRLIEQGHEVVGIDNLSRGKDACLEGLIGHKSFTFYRIDLTDVPAFTDCLGKEQAKKPIDEVWHLAANSDIPAGVKDISVDLKDTFMSTVRTLEMMKLFNIKKLAFASSSAVYGDCGDDLITETRGPLLPISNYGAMKAASESAISASRESFLSQAFIFRFPNVIGVPATHGVMLDFIRKLKDTPDSLTVLGNGTQQKAYLHVEDLISAMQHIVAKAQDKTVVYNIGPSDDGVTVRFIAEEVVRQFSPKAKIVFGTENRGWVGDVPKFRYSVAKLAALGWKAKYDSAAAVRKALSEIIAQEAVK